MKGPLLFAVALVMAACVLQVFGGGGSAPRAEAAPANTLQVTGVTCLSQNSLRVQFAWNPSGSGTQWLDLSIFNNGFAPGTFLGAGPLSPGTNSLVWDGLITNTVHYFRVNTFNGSFWEPSPTASFTTPNCSVAFSGATNLHLNAQACLANGYDRLDFGWTPSQQGIQFLDISTLNNNFNGGFTGLGPLPPSQNRLVLDNVGANVVVFVRVNTLTPIGWIPSQTLAFATSPCTPTPTTPAGFDTQPIIVNGSASGPNQAVLTDVRIGAHPSEGFDRIVFEYAGVLPDTTRIQYENAAVACGSGNTVPVAGSGTLVVHMTAARAHDDMGNVTVPDLDLDGTGAAIRQAVSTCDFEGVVDWAVGIDGTRAFRVTVLTNPSRIVIDVLR
jgi:hypothetical protein